MTVPAKMLLCWTVLALAGCAGPARRNLAHVPDWQEEESAVTTLSAGPALAGPASAPPAPIGNARPSAPTRTVANGTNSGSTAKEVSPSPAASTWVPLQRWLSAGALATLNRLGAMSAPTFALRSARGIMVLRAGSLQASWNGLDLRLGFAPQMIGDEPYVHSVDLQKTLQPLLAGPALAPSAEVVVIDPGHGGDDTGARSVLGDYVEKEMTLDWAVRVRDLLAAKGYEVFLTRSDDSTVGLWDRVAFTGSRSADLFVSLHFNSAGAKQSEAGLETYCLTPAGAPSSLVRGYPDEVGQSYPNNQFDPLNLLLATCVHRSLLQANGCLDRGVRRARFPVVLRAQECPAVLIEGGYLTNPQEARLIADPAYRQKLAEAVVRGLEDFLAGP